LINRRCAVHDPDCILSAVTGTSAHPLCAEREVSAMRPKASSRSGEQSLKRTVFCTFNPLYSRSASRWLIDILCVDPGHSASNIAHVRNALTRRQSESYYSVCVLPYFAAVSCAPCWKGRSRHLFTHRPEPHSTLRTEWILRNKAA
jgi:hypothetical protein